MSTDNRFQHTAARRRLGNLCRGLPQGVIVSTHSRPKAAGAMYYGISTVIEVSTHSRPKAAGTATIPFSYALTGFNTQPPEGGWAIRKSPYSNAWLFQHTAARRRLGTSQNFRSRLHAVSTHSRPKAAGSQRQRQEWQKKFQHTAARRRLDFHFRDTNSVIKFQHTAARRRLAFSKSSSSAGIGFNTQPPEGGWESNFTFELNTVVSTHSRPKAAGLRLQPAYP